MSKHTAGNLVVRYSEYDDSYYIAPGATADDHEAWVAQVVCDEPEAREYAAMFSAAPDMLAALKVATMVIGRHYHPESDLLLGMKDTIKKAEGKQ